MKPWKILNKLKAIRNVLELELDESSDSAIHTVYKRIKEIKGYKMT